MEQKILFELLNRALSNEPEGTGRATPPIAWSSTRGHVRKENQDRVLVASSPTGLVVAVVADGMGGMRDGSHAAALSVAAVATSCLVSSAAKLDVMLAEALHFANEAVYKTLHGEGGAAVAVAASSPAGHYIGHVGDARVYHADRANELAQLTVDDTVAAQLQCLGRSSGTETRPDTRLLQFAGLGRDLEPHVREIPTGGRALILTTDGVHGVPRSVFEWIVKSADGLQVLAKRLTQASEWNGGHDNATVVTLSLDNGKGGTSSPIESFEFWIPGKELVVSRPERSVAVPQAGTTVRPQAKSSKQKPQGKTRRKRTSSESALTRDQVEPQITIASFEAPPEASDESAKQGTKAPQAAKSSGKPEDLAGHPDD